MHILLHHGKQHLRPHSPGLGCAGGPLISKFVTVFRELGSYSELLRTQIEVILCESLQHTWLKVGIPKQTWGSGCIDLYATHHRAISCV